jgi:hypothetical protein
MTTTEFRANFPAGATVPPLLERLVDFQERLRRFYSGHFELTDGGPASAVATFDGDKDAAAQFALFGQEIDGSAFGFWLYEGRNLEDAPVVYLGSEGTGWTVLADTLEDFLRLLAIGLDDLGFAAQSLAFDEPQAPSESLVAFRKWLKTECGLSQPENPAAVISAAKRNHPDLQEWLSQWQARHFG